MPSPGNDIYRHPLKCEKYTGNSSFGFRQRPTDIGTLSRTSAEKRKRNIRSDLQLCEYLLYYGYLKQEWDVFRPAYST